MAAFEPGDRAGWFPADQRGARLQGVLTSTEVRTRAGMSRTYAAQVFPRLGMTREKESSVALALRLARTAETITPRQPGALTFADGFEIGNASGLR